MICYGIEYNLPQLLSSDNSFGHRSISCTSVTLVELLPPTPCPSPLTPSDAGLFEFIVSWSVHVSACFPDLILDQQELFSDLNDSMRVKVREALLKKHHHQNEKKRNNLIPIVRSFAEVGKKQSDPHSMDKNGKITRSDCFLFLLIRHLGTSWRCQVTRGYRLYLSNMRPCLLTHSTLVTGKKGGWDW